MYLGACLQSTDFAIIISISNTRGFRAFLTKYTYNNVFTYITYYTYIIYSIYMHICWKCTQFLKINASNSILSAYLLLLIVLICSMGYGNNQVVEFPQITPLYRQLFRWLRLFHTSVLVGKFFLNIRSIGILFVVQYRICPVKHLVGDNTVEVLIEHLLQRVGRFVPNKIIRVRNMDKPWFHDHCRHAFNLKQEANLRWARDRSRVNWEEFIRCQVRASET